MGTYNKQFELTIKEIDLIENSVRLHIHHLSHTETMAKSQKSLDNHGKIVELTQVLSSLHNQKKWYGQTHHTGTPIG